jgi:ADP-ribose pyrophosphatase YjhB (NUDIX family)
MSKFIDKLAFIYLENEKILMSLSRGKNTWYIPGGKREGQETDLQALTREVEEELTVKLIAKTIKLYGVFESQAHGHPIGTMVRMTCYTANFEGELLPASEIDQLSYFPYSRKNESSIVDHLIFDDLLKNKLIS